MDPGWIVPLGFFTFLGVVIIAPFWLRSREKQRFYETIRAAYESGAEMPPHFVAALGSGIAVELPIPAPERDLRRGVLFLAAGVGLLGLAGGLWWGLMPIDDLSAWESGGWVGGFGVVAAAVGLAHLGFWLARRRPARAG